jgi:hypothetical protein
MTPINAATLLRTLQKGQRDHDVTAHKDIYYLSSPNRVMHLTLHVSKYAGRLAKRRLAKKELEVTIVDAFLIALSAAEVLEIDLSQAFKRWTDPRKRDTLQSLGLILNKERIKAYTLPDWYFRQVADVAGKMAKACESLDHMEPVPYRDMLSAAILDLCRTTIVAAAVLALDLSAAVRKRWKAIEAKKIL